jgi:protease-4
MMWRVDGWRSPRRLAAALLPALVAPLVGCVVLVGSPLGLLERGIPPLEEVRLEGKGAAKILLIDVSGVISDVPPRRAFGLVEEESMVARIEAELRHADDDRHVKALLVHVRSPGGAVAASDDLFRALRRFAAKHEVPVVAALGGVAASGGYYVACAGDVIVAHPAGITGSIGVIMVNLNLSGLLAKVGIQDATVTSGAHKDMLSPFKAPNPGDREIAERVLATLYARFLDVVRERRPAIDDATLRAVADGRILDAQRAVAVGLADRIGDLHDAIEVARGLVGDEDARVVRYRRGNEPVESLHALAGVAPETVVPETLAQASALALDVAGPRFLYLWMPAVSLTRFAEAG